MSNLRTNGLVTLEASSRRERLSRALSRHPRWTKVAAQLDDAINVIGPGNAVGRRKGQVYLTLSYAGLMKGFNHYLTHGAEFDRHVASELLGEEEREAALAAAHPFFTVDHMRARGEVPNILKEFLQAWCFRLPRPSIQSRNLIPIAA